MTGEPVTASSGLGRIDLGQVIEAAIRLSQPGFDRRGIKVELAVAAGLRVQANPDHIAQVLLNLFQNAARHTPEGGAISIRTEVDDGSVVVSVSNSGECIPTVDLPHVFERFYRVEKSRDRSQGGAGIGLGVVHQVLVQPPQLSQPDPCRMSLRLAPPDSQKAVCEAFKLPRPRSSKPFCGPHAAHACRRVEEDPVAPGGVRQASPVITGRCISSAKVNRAILDCD